MFGFLSIFAKYSLSAQDMHSNQYTDDYKKLLSVYPGQKSLVIPRTVTSIYGKDETHFAFFDCTDIEKVTFEVGSQLEIIESHAFYCCYLITQIDLSVCTKLHTICDHCFKKCRKLSTITFPESLTKIENYCFEETGIVDIVIPKSIEIIEEGVFIFCQKLNEVTFENGSNITNLPDRLFEESGLKKVNLPNSLTCVNGGAFKRVNKLREITISKGGIYVISNNFLCTSNLTDLIVCPPALTEDVIKVPTTIKTIRSFSFHSVHAKEVVIGDNVTSIDNYAFANSMIQRMILKDTIQSIGEFAFDSCSKLMEVQLPNGIEKLERNLFSNNKFETFTVPDSVINITTECFSGCTQMRTIKLPSNLIEIGKLCFLKCTSLEKVILPKDLTIFGGGAFSGCTSINLSFATGSIFAIDEQFLITSDNVSIVRQYIGCNENSSVNIPDSVITIDSGSFHSNNYIRSIKFGPESQLQKIKEKAFFSCTNLFSIEFPESLTTIETEAFISSSIEMISFGTKINAIGYRAFESTNLKTVAFSATANNLYLNDNAFFNCFILEKVKFPENINYIGQFCFSNTFKLKNLVIPATLQSCSNSAFKNSGIESVSFTASSVSLKTINSYAFCQNKALTEFKFAEGIKTIKDSAFSNTGLVNITLPSSIETLENNCFSNCVNLTEINFGGSSSNLQTIQGGVLEGCLKLETIKCDAPNFVVKQGALYNKDKTKIYAFPSASNIHIVQLPSEVLEISPSTFYSCTNIYSITVPDDSKLMSIGAKAFANCASMRTINIPISTTIVGPDAFKGCSCMSCGIIISNNTKEFRDLLINTAKMPRRCFESCIVARTQVSCSKYPMSRILFIGFSILLM